MEKILLKEESYLIQGAAFEVYKKVNSLLRVQRKHMDAASREAVPERLVLSAVEVSRRMTIGAFSTTVTVAIPPARGLEYRR
ncbi:MAG: hypothetical protein ACOC4C_05495 [Fibrobacterota bacterium]